MREKRKDLVAVLRRVACELIKQRSFHLCNFGLDHGARSALLVFVLVFVLVHPIQQRLCQQRPHAVASFRLRVDEACAPPRAHTQAVRNRAPRRP